jgi:hypothetical protein
VRLSRTFDPFAASVDGLLAPKATNTLKEIAQSSLTNNVSTLDSAVFGYGLLD